jgi:hypothetical protein
VIYAPSKVLQPGTLARTVEETIDGCGDILERLVGSGGGL